ncbi:DUF6252 family protein [Formosa sp. A9]|uniref:DUF6252 family protein n=1 Tax=Formosa sp. A9 TaxID=3442641 RepID=UPI003EBD1492
MKKLLLILTVLTTLYSCSEDDDQPTNPIDQLPPVTQTGEQTFGCLINGEPFVPPVFGRNAPKAFYQLVDGAYFLGISASINSSPLKSLGIGADAISIKENMSYTFTQEDKDNPAFYARYLLGGGINAEYTTTIVHSGIINISKFDEDNFIISGTFEFEAEEINTGEIIQVSEGRFDLNYTN